MRKNVSRDKQILTTYKHLGEGVVPVNIAGLAAAVIIQTTLQIVATVATAIISNWAMAKIQKEDYEHDRFKS